MIINLKDKTLCKKGFVHLKDSNGEDFPLPIKTLSILEDTDINIEDLKINLPKVSMPPTPSEEAMIRRIDPNFSTNKNTATLVIKYDVSTQAYKDALIKYDAYKKLWEVIKYIDMDYKDKDTVDDLWTQLELKKGDIIGVCNYFGFKLKLRSTDFEDILFEVKKLDGISAFDKLSELKKLTGKETHELFSLMDLGDKLKKIREENISKKETEEPKE